MATPVGRMIPKDAPDNVPVLGLVVECTECDGRGYVEDTFDHHAWGPGCTRQITCPECMGAGWVVEECRP